MMQNSVVCFNIKGTPWYIMDRGAFLTHDISLARRYDSKTANEISSYLHLGRNNSSTWYCVRDGFDLGKMMRVITIVDRSKCVVEMVISGTTVEVIEMPTFKEEG